MLRCRIWNQRSPAYVCAFCGHPALSRQRQRQHDLGRRNYSDTSSPPSKSGPLLGAWGSKKSVSATGSSTVPRPVGPIGGSGWGKPKFGVIPPLQTSNLDGQQANTTSSGSIVDDGLLPHERAARDKLKKPTPPPPPTPTPKSTSTATRNRSWSGLGGLDPIPGRSRSPPQSRSSVQKTGLGLPERAQEGDPKKKPLEPKAGLSKTIDAGQSDTDKSDQWGLLARRTNRPSSVEQPSSTGSGWGSLAKKRDNSSEDATPVTKDEFFTKLQEHMHSKQSKIPDAPSDSPSAAPANSSPPIEDVVVEVEVEVTDPCQTNKIDESYEIDRDSRKRDKGGRRGEDYGSSRGSRKSTSPQRWEDENEEWDAQGAKRAAQRRQRKAEEKARRKAKAEAAAPQSIFLPEFISISNLGVALKMKPQEFLRALTEMGFEDITEESIMTGETASLVAMEFGFEATVDTGAERDLKPRPPPEDLSSLPPRPPVVTIMGHVDHGKTTLLDFLRKSSVAAQEHGGITQHIGAFMVKMSSGQLITFLDTPGHAAFLTMRQRGANVTDIVVLVVAADDSVKPQTLEALKHARAAKVPIIVAINKIDKEDARPDQVKTDLARHGLEIEDIGGDVQVVCVSGKTGQGMDKLEESIGALAEILDIRAETDGMAEAWVLEASVKSQGKSANVLVKRGTLRPGDQIVAGTTWARIRLLRNEAGQELDEAPPGTPVEILGWREELPAAGDQILQAPDEDRARTAVDYREEMREREASSKQLAEQEQREREAKAAAEADEEAGADPAVQIVNFAVRGDVVGSVEAVCATITEIGNNEIQPCILRSSAGQVSETDVEHAAASKSIIVNFNSPIAGHIRRMAEDKSVKLIDHSVIYHLADEVKQVLSERLAPKITYKVLAEAEILEVFSINIKGRKYKNVAGCRVRNGAISRSHNVRIIRKGEKIYDGKIETLKHGKKDMIEIKKGSECGISFDGFTDFEVQDQIQMYEEVREKRFL